MESGNLAGHLLVLRQGLLALADRPAAPAKMFAGFADTFALFEEALCSSGIKPSPESKEKINHLKTLLTETSCETKADPSSLKNMGALSAELGALLRS